MASKIIMWFLIAEFGCNFIMQTVSYSFYKNAKKMTDISSPPQFIQFNDSLTGYGNNLDSENNNKVILFFGGSNYIAYNSVGKYSSKFAYPFISVVLGYRLEWYNQLFSLTLQHPAVLLPVFGRGKAGVFLKGPAEMGKVVKADFLNDLRD